MNTAETVAMIPAGPARCTVVMRLAASRGLALCATASQRAEKVVCAASQPVVEAWKPRCAYAAPSAAVTAYTRPRRASQQHNAATVTAHANDACQLQPFM